MINQNIVTGDGVRGDNLVVTHVDQFAIIERADGALYYLECDAQQAPVGTYVEDSGLKSIAFLDQDIRCKILDVIQ